MSRAVRLIGRDPALAAASSVVDDARRGAGQFLMISGEASIGKTAMLAALIDQADPVSQTGPAPLVLRGFCWEGDGAPPYWPWSQVLRASGLPAAELGEAGWLLQSGSGAAEPLGAAAAEPASAAAAADAQFRLFEAVSRCLGRLAAGRLVLVVLDDLHWADEPSLRLLRFLARALTARAVLLLGAYRDTEASGLLRAAALLELGDPEGRDALLSYITLAGNLGHARGRWAALTRQATFAQLAGRAEESARLGEQALELGLAIGEPDAVGCFCTSRAALTALGVSGPPIELDASDPLWPMLPVFRAWPFAARGEAAAAAAALGDFSVLDITMWTGLEALAAAAVVFAVAGSDAQRRWVYERLRPHAGTHVVVGGCASYHAAVDHHLGALAASLGDTAAAEAHFRAALAMHERLGAAGWARLSEQALAGLQVAAPDRAANELRLEHGVRLLRFGAGRSGCPTPRAWPTSRP